MSTLFANTLHQHLKNSFQCECSQTNGWSQIPIIPQVFPSGSRIRFFHLASCQWQRGCGRKRSWKPGPDVGGSDIDKSGIAADLMYIHGHKCNKCTEIYMNCCWGGPGFRHKSSEEEVLLLLVCCCPQERVLHSYSAAADVESRRGQSARKRRWRNADQGYVRMTAFNEETLVSNVRDTWRIWD